MIADHAQRGDGWLLGGGWNYYWFEGGNPPAALLDAITNQPVYLGGADGHSGWANSSALALAGITAGTADPVAAGSRDCLTGARRARCTKVPWFSWTESPDDHGPTEVREALLEGNDF